MKVICIANKGIVVPAEIRRENFSAETIFPVTIGATYSVYAMGQSVGSPLLEYLVCDELGYPFYCPSHLFKIVDNALPLNWGFTEWLYTDFHYRIWGYKEILDYHHNEGIHMRRNSDMEIFAKAKQDIDERLWIEGELEVIAKLCHLNGLPYKVPLIDKRIKSNSVFKTLFLGKNQLTLARPHADNFKVATVNLNDGEYEGECMFVVDDDNIEGIEVILYDGSVPRVIRNINPNS